MKILYQLAVALSLCASPAMAMFQPVCDPVGDIDIQLIEHIRNDDLGVEERLSLVQDCVNQDARVDIGWSRESEWDLGSKTALEWLVVSNRPELVPVLISDNTNKRALADAFNLAVGLSENGSHENIVKSFIAAGADVHGQGLRGPIFSAKDPKVAAILIEAGADANAITIRGQTPIYEAIEKQADFELLRTLIDHGAFLEVPDAKSTLELARNYPPLTKWLLDHVAKRDIQTHAKLISTLNPMPMDQIKLIQDYLSSQLTTNQQSQNGVGVDAEQALVNFQNLFENLKNLHGNQRDAAARASTMTRLRSLRRMVDVFLVRMPQSHALSCGHLLNCIDQSLLALSPQRKLEINLNKK